MCLFALVPDKWILLNGMCMDKCECLNSRGDIFDTVTKSSRTANMWWKIMYASFLDLKNPQEKYESSQG